MPTTAHRPTAAYGSTTAHRPTCTGGRVRRLAAGPPSRLPTVWVTVTLATVWVVGRCCPAGGVLSGLIAAVRRRARHLRAGSESGLTTVEVAVITAVLLGLAAALLAAITVVVRRNIGRIQ
jgi:hypothetical protein